MIAEPAVRVRIRFDRRWATYVAEHTWHASQQLAPAPDGGVELAMQVGGTAELRSWILSFGAGAEVLEPASLRAEVVKELAGAAERYRGGAALAAPARQAERAARRSRASARR